MNALKTMVLIVTLTLTLIAAWGILDGMAGMTFTFIIVFGMNFISYWFSDRIVLKMYGARQVSVAA
jgi:heat shock protein HtpX